MFCLFSISQDNRIWYTANYVLRPNWGIRSSYHELPQQDWKKLLRREFKTLNHWRQLGRRYQQLEERQLRKRRKARRQKTSRIDASESSSKQTTKSNDGLAAISSVLKKLLGRMMKEREVREEPRRYLCHQGVPVSDKLNSSPMDNGKHFCLLDDSNRINLSESEYGLTDVLIADAIDHEHVIAASGRVDETGTLPGEVLAWMLPEGDLVFRTKLPVPLEDGDDVNHRNISSTFNVIMNRESLLDIGWKAKLMVTAEEECLIGGGPTWKKIHIYDISDSRPRRIRSWTEDDPDGIRIDPLQVFVLPGWIDRKKHPELPNEVIIVGFGENLGGRAGILIHISVDTPAYTRLEFSDKPLDIFRFHPHFPDIIIASTFENEIIVWSSKTGRCLAKTRLPSTGCSSKLTSIVLGTATDLESMDDAKKYGCNDARGLRIVATTTTSNERSNIYVFQLNLPHPDVYAQPSKPDETSYEIIGSLKLMTVHDIPEAYYTNSDVSDRLLFTAGAIDDEGQSACVYVYDLVTGECLFHSNKLGDWKNMATLSGTILVQSERDLFTIADTYESMQGDGDEDNKDING
jgi:hypothetical protein